MKSHAKVVVIGGGVVGASVLYHLTKAGWRDVLLIELLAAERLEDGHFLLLDHRQGLRNLHADLLGNRVRRQALHHALTSYVFGTVIVAITVSSVASLLGR